MDHKVRNVQELYETAVQLYDNVVVKGDSSAENMLQDLNNAINNLEANWKGADAGVKIQEVVKVHNNLVKVRNALAKLSCDSSSVASIYREIQVTNGAHLDTFAPLTSVEKTNLEDYVDDQDTIDINPDAVQGKQNIDTVIGSMDKFTDCVKAKYAEIMDNWLVGAGRDSAQEAFDEFLANAEKYKKTLSEVSTSVGNALKNYQF